MGDKQQRKTETLSIKNDAHESRLWVSRRWFIGLLTTIPLLVGRRKAAADTALREAPTKPKPTDTEAESLHQRGVDLLRKGQHFELAATLFARAQKADPEDPAHALARGCAFASRAASLSLAARYDFSLRQCRSEFGNVLKAWKSERAALKTEGASPEELAEFDQTRPMKPAARAFPIKDDNVPFRLNRAQTEARLTELCQNAIDAWETGITLAKTPEERAHAYYIQGWGFRILRQCLIPDNTGVTIEDTVRAFDGRGATPYVIKNVPSKAAMVAAMDKAIAASPTNVLYWQSKGDILPCGKEAEAAYRQALALRSANSLALYYRLYRNATHSVYETTWKDWQTAQSFLIEAAKLDPDNAWPLYEEAGVLLRIAPFDKVNTESTTKISEAVQTMEALQKGRRAIDRIEAGNRTREYRVPRYTNGKPSMLAAAWRYDNPFDLDAGLLSRTRTLARSVAGYIELHAQISKQGKEVARAVAAALPMAHGLCGDWSLKDEEASGSTLIEVLTGIAAARNIYSAVLRIGETHSDSQKQAQLSQDHAAFESRAQAFRTAASQRTDHDSYEQY